MLLEDHSKITWLETYAKKKIAMLHLMVSKCNIAVFIINVSSLAPAGYAPVAASKDVSVVTEGCPWGEDPLSPPLPPSLAGCLFVSQL